MMGDRYSPHDSGASLGDILGDAINRSVGRIYDVRMGIATNEKKIEAIKDIRYAFGTGLGESKAFVESFDYTGCRRTVRLNERQLARLSALVYPAFPQMIGEDIKPSYLIQTVTPVEPSPVVDADFARINPPA